MWGVLDPPVCWCASLWYQLVLCLDRGMYLLVECPWILHNGIGKYTKMIKNYKTAVFLFLIMALGVALQNHCNKTYLFQKLFQNWDITIYHIIKNLLTCGRVYFIHLYVYMYIHVCIYVHMKLCAYAHADFLTEPFESKLQTWHIMAFFLSTVCLNRPPVARLLLPYPPVTLSSH